MLTLPKIKIAIFLTCFGIVMSLPFVLTAEYAHVNSPDGRFYAVATSPVWYRFISMMPGSAGDKPGSVTIYTADGHSCGRTPVDMVSMIRDLQWNGDRAEIRLVAEWHFSTGRVHRHQ